MKKYALALFAFAAVGLTSCGPKAFVKGDYEDTEKENNLNDLWSETDMQKIVHDLVGGMVQHPSIGNAK